MCWPSTSEPPSKQTRPSAAFRSGSRLPCRTRHGLVAVPPAPARPRHFSSWRASSRGQACPSSSRTSRVSRPAWHSQPTARMPGSRSGSRRSASPRARRSPRGPALAFGRAGHAGPGHGVLLRAAAAGAHPRPQHDPDERPLAGLQVLRRPGPAAPGSRRPAHDAARSWIPTRAGLCWRIRRAAASTLGVILRALTTLEQDRTDRFFGEPAFEVEDLLRTTPDGEGVVHLPDLRRHGPASPLLDLHALDAGPALPGPSGAGDLPKPKLVFFFDEAHLLFRDAPKALLEQVELTVRLIRSKGVGVYFVTHSRGLPSSVLAQLGNRVQHALRVFTPEDADDLRKAVRTFPMTDHFDVATTLTSLGIGEALVTVLSRRACPRPGTHAAAAAHSLMAPMPADLLQHHIRASGLYATYAQPIDRESAHESWRPASQPREPPRVSLPGRRQVPRTRVPRSWNVLAARSTPGQGGYKRAASAASAARREADAARREADRDACAAMRRSRTSAVTSSEVSRHALRAVGPLAHRRRLTGKEHRITTCLSRPPTIPAENTPSAGAGSRRGWSRGPRPAGGLRRRPGDLRDGARPLACPLPCPLRAGLHPGQARGAAGHAGGPGERRVRAAPRAHPDVRVLRELTHPDEDYPFSVIQGLGEIVDDLGLDRARCDGSAWPAAPSSARTRCGHSRRLCRGSSGSMSRMPSATCGPGSHPRRWPSSRGLSHRGPGYQAAIEAVRPGVTERAVAAEIEAAMRRAGAGGPHRHHRGLGPNRPDPGRSTSAPSRPTTWCCSPSRHGTRATTRRRRLVLVGTVARVPAARCGHPCPGGVRAPVAPRRRGSARGGRGSAHRGRRGSRRGLPLLGAAQCRGH